MKLSRRHFVKSGALLIPAALASAQAGITIIRPRSVIGSAGAASTTYINSENFEGTGRPTNWTDVGTPDYDASTSGLSLEASQCLKCFGYTNAALTGAKYSGFSYTAGATLECYFLLRIARLLSSTGTRNIFLFSTTGSTRGTITLRMTGGNHNLRAQASGGSTADCVTTVAADTTYHVWVTYKAGSGANAITTVAFSTDGVRPTNGNNFASSSDGTGTTAANEVTPESAYSSTNGYDLYFDKFRLADSSVNSIPDNPT